MAAGDIRRDLTAKLRPPGDSPIPCKVCGAPASPMGTVDFNRTCEDPRGLALPQAGVPIAYHRCGACSLVFTAAFDDWTQADFEAHVYNADYETVDPDYVATRPDAMAAWLVGRFGAFQEELDILDYGGGNGRFAERLREAGFRCETYDPFNPAFAARPARRFNLITCFETLEHMPDPVGGAGDIAGLVAADGAVLMSTLTQPADFDAQGLGWWYIGPRNGHVTIYSRTALGLLWERVGFPRMASLNDDAHIAINGAVPGFLRALTGG